MLSKKTLKEYDLNSEYDYYGMIYQSYLNGQFEQAKRQISKLSKMQKLNCLHHIEGIADNPDIVERAERDIILN